MYYLITAVIFVINALSENSGRIINNSNELEIEQENILRLEEAESIGGSIQLNCDEKYANKFLMQMKKDERKHFVQPNGFLMSQGFLDYKNEINQSKVYSVIKSMPKGAVLHVHTGLMLKADDIIKFTYEDHLYVCQFDNELQVKFLFSDREPAKPCETKWELLSDLRDKARDVDKLDDQLKKYFSIEPEDTKDDDLNKIWRIFEMRYSSIHGIKSYRPVHEKFFKKSLQNFYEDNILYVEIRNGLSSLYELNGTVYDPMFTLQEYVRISREFTEEHPDFVGVKLIISQRKTSDNKYLKKILDLVVKAKEAYPHFVAGFDLVGQEDVEHELKYYLSLLKEYKPKLDYYFHAGETNWYGTSKDENMATAILLGTKRIGHGYALIKHPKLMDMIKEKDIAIEVNVVSNNVLKLVDDVRNHPLATYFAMGLPVVLSSDDPGMWGADPMSHDFYVAFMAVISANGDIKTLKQLALNSIKYSAMDDQMKARAYDIFDRKWQQFIEHVIEIG